MQRPDVGEVDAAVDLDLRGEAALVDRPLEPPDLVETRGQEGLAPETRV